MAQEVTLGGERLGSGNKQKIELHNYGMNSFNQEQDFKSSMAPGILYPFIKLIGTNHGTFDIDLDTFVRTLPTKGPLFGSFKLQVDLFNIPLRLYQGVLHNNPVELGLNMNQVYLPKILIKTNCDSRVQGSNEYNYQINESSLMKYLGISGLGTPTGTVEPGSPNGVEREINAIPILAYYDIFKCYYSNKQEENAYVIIPGEIAGDQATYEVLSYFDINQNREFTMEQPHNVDIGTYGYSFAIEAPQATEQDIKNSEIEISFTYDDGESISNEEIDTDIQTLITANVLKLTNRTDGNKYNWEIYWNNRELLFYIINEAGLEDSTVKTLAFKFIPVSEYDGYTSEIKLQPFALKNIDKMRAALLGKNEIGERFWLAKSGGLLNNPDWTESSGEDHTGYPYSALFRTTSDGVTWNAFTQNGLVVKTYQSDLFNNWLNSEYVDGTNGISKMSAVDTSDGNFTMDSLVLAERIYELLNRILVSGGTYQDWQEAVYGEGAVRICETPMYVGGMSSEIMFEEVISNSETKVDGNFQALGSLGGKGTQVGQKGGHNIHIKCDEPSYIMGIVSITPRICYSQGNDWDMTDLDTIDDLHKPEMDGIGFQDLSMETMAWWSTTIKQDDQYSVHKKAVGKQTAWIHYQTAVDKCYGDFAKQDGFAFMVLNRNYEIGATPGTVKDITTYIDPAKYNYAFAYTDLAAQNFWVQIHSKVIARRKMGAQQIPNL